MPGESMPQLSPACIRLLCTIGSSMTTPATGDQTEREMIALGLVRHITSGHAIGLTLTAAGRVEFERRWRYRAC